MPNKAGGMQNSIPFHAVKHQKEDGGAYSSLMVTYWFPPELQRLEKQEGNKQLNTGGRVEGSTQKHNSHNSTIY